MEANNGLVEDLLKALKRTRDDNCKGTFHLNLRAQQNGRN